MRLKKFAGVLMSIGAIALLIGGFFPLMEIAAEQKIIFNSKLLGTNVINPINDGKRIIMILDDKMGYAVDKEMGLGFKASVVRRDVDRFERKKEGGYHWRRVPSYDTDLLRFKTLYGSGKEKTLSIDPTFEEVIKVEKNLGVKDLTEVSLKRFNDFNTKVRCHTVTSDETTYFTDADKVAFKDLNSVNPVKLDAQVGCFRVKYTKFDIDGKAVALIGLQRGKLIKANLNIGGAMVVKGSSGNMLKKRDIVKAMKMNKVIIFALMELCAAFLATIGISWSCPGYEETDDDRKDEEKKGRKDGRKA